MSVTTALRQVRVDLVGSFLRPAALQEAFARHGRGEAGEAELQAAQDQAVSALIARLESLGLPLLTDGEFRRLNFQDSFAHSVRGLATEHNRYQFHQQRAAGGKAGERWEPEDPVQGDPALGYWQQIVGRLQLTRNLPLAEYGFASGVATRPVKVTLINADRIAEDFPYQNAAGVYPDKDGFMADVVAVQREMVSQLVAAGCPYVQLDGPSYTRYVDTVNRERMRSRGEDPGANLDRAIAADNAVIAGFPDTVFGVHLCRGNQRSMWHREGAYDEIAERLFNELNCQRLLLEYDTERAGGFAPLRFVPRGKLVVLGLISSKVPTLESADSLKRRIDEATRYISPEQLALSPQCGFASNILGNLLTEDDQWRKLERMLRVSEAVWPA